VRTRGEDGGKMGAGKMEREDGAGKGRGIGVLIDEMKDDWIVGRKRERRMTLSSFALLV
jgi:hypothetical protein